MQKFKLIVFVVLTVFGSGIVFANAEKFKEANDLYIEEHYKTAAKMYESMLDSANQNSEIYYNLGNAYYKSKRLGLAIWAYEKSLKIDPRNEDAKFNLEFANLQTVEKIEQPDPALSEWIKRILFGSHVNLWAFVSVASSLLFSLTILIFILSKSRRLRNMSMMSGLLFCLLLIFSTTTAYFHKQSILSQTEAIVISELSNVRLSPMDKAKVSFEIHEGVKVKILQQNDSWIQVEVNGNSGWILEDEVKKI